MFGRLKKNTLIAPAQALPGRTEVMPVPDAHFVSGRPLQPPFPDHCETVLLALGCFWGAERVFWQLDGVFTTAVGYTAGYTPNPTYEEVCSGQTGHTEAVLVVYDPGAISLEQLLAVFWESHDPTQGMRQGNDVGTQYRSGIYVYGDPQNSVASESRGQFQQALDSAGRGRITTEIKAATPFYYAESYHQQYLAKNPGGYCGLGGCGVTFPRNSAAKC